MRLFWLCALDMLISFRFLFVLILILAPRWDFLPRPRRRWSPLCRKCLSTSREEGDLLEKDFGEASYVLRVFFSIMITSTLDEWQKFQKKHKTYRKRLRNTRLNFLSVYFSIKIPTFFLTSLLSLYFSIEISMFSLLFYWNLHFSLDFSIEISTFSWHFYWNI